MLDYYFNMFIAVSAYSLGVLTSGADYNFAQRDEKAFTWVFAFVVGALWPVAFVYCACRMLRGK